MLVVPETQPESPPPSPVRMVQTVAIDLACLLIFVVAGRGTHSEATSVQGIAATVWPFVVGYLVTAAIARIWKDPMGIGAGIVVWVGTVGLGLWLRVWSGRTAELPFIIVAFAIVGLMFSGWRIAARKLISIRGN